MTLKNSEVMIAKCRRRLGDERRSVSPVTGFENAVKAQVLGQNIRLPSGHRVHGHELFATAESLTEVGAGTRGGIAVSQHVRLVEPEVSGRVGGTRQILSVEHDHRFR